jgi:TPR repeat protein
MRTLIAILTALMLFAATPVVAGDVDDALELAKAQLAVIKAQTAFDERNFPKAFRLNKPLAEQGNVFAQLNLGWMYRNGRGVPDQDVKAFNWYRKAAEQGNVKAQYNLGQMYANGEGVPEDYVEGLCVAQHRRHAGGC